MTAPVRTIPAESSSGQDFTIPIFGDPEVLPEIVYQLINAFLGAISKAHGINCYMDIGEDCCGVKIGKFEASHLYDDEPGSSSDAMLCELAFNMLCAGMNAEKISKEYF